MTLNLSLFDNMPKFLKCLLVVFLVFALIFCVFGCSYAHAIALPLIGVVAICATILIGAGVIASNDSDLGNLAQNFYNSCSLDVQAELTTIAAEYGQNATGVGFSFHASATILTALTEWLIKQSFNFAAGGNLADCTMDTAAYSITSLGSIDLSGLISNEFMENITSESQLTTIPIESSILNKIIVIGNGMYSRLGYVNGTLYALVSASLDNITSDNWILYGESVPDKCILAKSTYNDYYYLRYYYNGKVWSVSNALFNSSSTVYGEAGSTFQNTSFPSVNSKSNTTFFPLGVTSAASSSTQFPIGTAEKALTTDLPLTIPADGVNSTTTTGDVRVGSDAGSDSGTSTLTDVINGIKSIPKVIADAIGALFVPNISSGEIISDVMGSANIDGVNVDFRSYVSSIAIPDVKVHWKDGHDYIIVDNGNLRDNIDTFRKFISVFLGILVVIFNYNMLMKLLGMGHFTVNDSMHVTQVENWQADQMMGHDWSVK